MISLQIKHIEQKLKNNMLIINIFAILLFVILYLFFCIFLFHPKLIYQPEIRPSNKDFEYFVEGTEQIKIKTADEIELDIFILNNNSDIDLIYLHGQSINLEIQKNKCKLLSDNFNCNVIMPFYRQYLYNGGHAGEVELMLDIEGMSRYIVENRNKNKLIIFGTSLGCATANYLATILPQNYQFLVILENPFINLNYMANDRMGKLYWIKFLLTEEWPNDQRVKYLKNQKIPTMFIVSNKDETIKNYHSMHLIKMMGDTACSYVIMEEATHTNAFTYDGFYIEILKFINKYFD
ncbi:Protein ABHD13 [Astathelohania contejeani]|uniref:Protein ABHD13 n=1 Tax=Astathelohania contejeani TaxID=164912 RepID=A0ABQ7HWF6_9MICR|nr:Protein ABHD13 [Thelohania contejeani]